MNISLHVAVTEMHFCYFKRLSISIWENAERCFNYSYGQSIKVLLFESNNTQLILTLADEKSAITQAPAVVIKSSHLSG